MVTFQVYKHGHARSYTARRGADGEIIVNFGHVHIVEPTRHVLHAAALALQEQEQCEVIDLADYR